MGVRAAGVAAVVASSPLAEIVARFGRWESGLLWYVLLYQRGGFHTDLSVLSSSNAPACARVC